jgi:hypothetical protein
VNDPIGAAAALLVVPVVQVYAYLWRLGILDAYTSPQQ